MAREQPAPPAKLVMGIMYADDHIFARTTYTLIQKFGPIQLNGPTIPFAFTKYYEEEMGASLKKTYIAFMQTIQRESLPSIKQFTNTIEQRFSREGKRTVNIDPGYVTEHQLVLASAKEHPYRVYLNDGIYAQLILVYTKQGWVSVEKTFADYQQKEVQEFLTNVRKTF
ncbi:DUF4416 family protein [Candidatus Woesearchaeota archaeon]|nr:DUF4416 family protein [Candidatus Woesearchaeota archaeon]